MFTTLQECCETATYAFLQKLVMKKLGLREEQLTIDGFTLSYARRGGADPLLLVHGFATDKHSWSQMIHHIERSRPVISIDLPGWGRSSFDPKARYTPEDQAHRLEAFRKALGLERWHLAGISMGGAIVGTYAALYPDRVLSLSLLDAAGISGTRLTPFFHEVQAGRNPLIVEKPGDLDTLLAFVFLKPPRMPGFMRRAMIAHYRQRLDIQKQLFTDLIAVLDGVEQGLPRITAPIQVIWGRHDQVVDVSCVDTLKRLRSDLKVTIFEDCAHFPIMEKPRATARALVEHSFGMSP